jgi:hypothetical protein
MKKIARVFPSKTAGSPDDLLAFFGPPGLFPPDVDEVHISVAFTWDRQRASVLADDWFPIAPVKIGGPGWSNEAGADFVPGMYLKNGFTITSRGCPNRCKHCAVHIREPRLRELQICEGNIVQDDNLLACSERHIKSVFRMLGRQRRLPDLRGLEAKLLRDWHVDLFCYTWPSALWFAYDEPADYEPLITAGRKLWEAGFDNRRLFSYVLIGQPGDTIGSAETRLRQTWRAGFMPFAMLWRDETGYRDPAWIHWSRPWKRPAAIKKMCEQENMEVCHTSTNSAMLQGLKPHAGNTGTSA